MSDDLIQKLRNSPPREICEHGSQRVKCVHCDNDRLEAEIEQLRARVAALEESTHYANGCADLAMKHRDIAEAERDALRARIFEAPTMIYGQSALAGGMPYSLNGKRVAVVQLYKGECDEG